MTVAVPTLETERLLLRPWREDDYEPYARLMADAEWSKYIGGPLSDIEAWRKMAGIVGHWQLRGYGTWAVARKCDDAFVGYCGPWFPHGFPEPEIGWALLPAHARQGYATEAARAAVAHAFVVLGWTTAISIIAEGNTASERVAERLGAVRERELEFRGWPVAIWRHPTPSDVT
jgi:RimJ/RimL family protein N-acetyltransferase